MLAFTSGLALLDFINFSKGSSKTCPKVSSPAVHTIYCKAKAKSAAVLLMHFLTFQKFHRQLL